MRLKYTHDLGGLIQEISKYLIINFYIDYMSKLQYIDMLG